MNDKNVCKVASINNEQWPHRSRKPDPWVNSSVSPPESPWEKSPDVFPNCQYLLKIAKAGPALCQFLREQLRFCLQQLPVCIHTGLLGEPQNNKIMLSPDSNSLTLLHFINYTCLRSWVFPTLITKGNEGWGWLWLLSQRQNCSKQLRVPLATRMFSEACWERSAGRWGCFSVPGSHTPPCAWSWQQLNSSPGVHVQAVKSSQSPTPRRQWPVFKSSPILAARNWPWLSIFLKFSIPFFFFSAFPRKPPHDSQTLWAWHHLLLSGSGLTQVRLLFTYISPWESCGQGHQWAVLTAWAWPLEPMKRCKEITPQCCLLTSTHTPRHPYCPPKQITKQWQ